jgi:hypothetical protein
MASLDLFLAGKAVDTAAPIPAFADEELLNAIREFIFDDET